MGISKWSILLVNALLLRATDALMFSDGAKRAPRTEAKMTKTAKRFLAALTRNVDAWYGALPVKPGQALYLAPDKRVRIW